MEGRGRKRRRREKKRGEETLESLEKHIPFPAGLPRDVKMGATCATSHNWKTVDKFNQQGDPGDLESLRIPK